LTIVSAEAANQVEFDAAVAKLIAVGAEAIYPGSVLAYNLRERLIELASKNRVPVIGLRGLWADIGAIFSYGTSLDDQHRRSALVVDKVLKGARPADIPVELPTTFQLVVNVRAAKSLGITIPPSVLLRADRVIE
jgi:putative ABC transport system substrate-binding protein